MRCRTCHADNPPQATACERCGAAILRKARKRGLADETDSPFGPLSDGPNRRAFVAYRCALAGLIPVVGLVAGPLAVLLGLYSWTKDGKKPDFAGISQSRAAVVLGAATAWTNWVGLTLMVLGMS